MKSAKDWIFLRMVSLHITPDGVQDRAEDRSSGGLGEMD